MGETDEGGTAVETKTDDGTTPSKIDAQSGLAPAADERLAYRGVFQRILTRPEIGAALGALAIWIFFWAVSVPFGRAGGASSILDVAASPLGIMAVAVAMLMIGGEFDLSSGAATGALAIVTILIVRDVTGLMPGGGLSLFVALPLSLAVALGLGWFNGTVVNRTGLPSFIVTLGSFFVLKGAKLGFSKLIVGQQQVGKLDDLLAQAVYISESGELVVFDAGNTVEVSVQGQQLINVAPEVREQIQFNVDNGLDPFESLAPQVVNSIIRPDNIEVFTVPPPTVDLIETNIADGLEPLAGVSEDLIGVGDRGYSFMVDVFAAEWLRNEHVWNGRDWFYIIGVVGGFALCALAIYEMNFRRREDTTSSRSAFAVLGGILALLLGWALLRDVARVNELVDLADLGSQAGLDSELARDVLVDIEASQVAGVESALASELGATEAMASAFLADPDPSSGLYRAFAWILTAVGLGGLAAGIGLELRSTRGRILGLITFLAGVAVSLVGVWRLHVTDSTSANWTAAIIIGAGMAIGFLGWGMWRYRGRGGVDDAFEAMAESAAGMAESGLTRVVTPLVAGVIALALSVGIALWLNPDNGFDLWPTTTEKTESVLSAQVDEIIAGELGPSVESRLDATVQAEVDKLTNREQLNLGERGLAKLTDAARNALVRAEFDSLPAAEQESLLLDAQARAETENPLNIVTVTSGTVGLVALIVGVAVALLSQVLNLKRLSFMRVLQDHGLAAIAAGLVGFLATYSFFFLATEQGARAIGFIVFAGAGAAGLLSAVNRGRKHSNALGSALLMATAAAVMLFALFVRSESGTPKFRTQAFSFLLIIAAVMAIWAFATLMFEERRSFDPGADKMGTRMLIAGGIVIVLGLTTRLMWVTDAELVAGIPPVKFSVRILWFLGFTALCSWVLARTKFGSWTFAVGGNAQAARQVGVPAARTKTQLFMLVSFAAWLVGLLLAFRLNAIQASTGDGEEFEYIIAAVVGGTMLTGGYGSTIGAAIGAFIMAMSVQGIPSARWNSDWRFVFLGAILLTSVIANNYIKAKAEAAR